MKIILSRKGFDSGYEKVPSPIMPDGTLLSLPIPNEDDMVEYEQLRYKEKSYAQIISELTKCKFSEKNCHLYPDIRRDVLARSEKWTPSFGQTSAALTHLRNEDVGKDDLFLFFGWFRKVEEINGEYQYVKEKQSNKHVIYGYLQVGEILCNPTRKQHPELGMHPHLDRERDNNAIFVARKTLSWNEDIPGAGCLEYKFERVLTKKKHPRSHWQLPDFLKEVRISYHSENSWKEDYFKSADKGQEFVISSDGNDKVEKWARDLINLTV